MEHLLAGTDYSTVGEAPTTSCPSCPRVYAYNVYATIQYTHVYISASVHVLYLQMYLFVLCTYILVISADKLAYPP